MNNEQLQFFTAFENHYNMGDALVHKLVRGKKFQTGISIFLLLFSWFWYLVIYTFHTGAAACRQNSRNYWCLAVSNTSYALEIYALKSHMII